MEGFPVSLAGIKKAVAHSAKYPSNDVVGALAGDHSSLETFPMFHTRVTAPTTEVALEMLSQYNLVGFYESRIRSSEAPLEPSKLMLSLCEALKSKGVAKPLVMCIETDWETSRPLVVYSLDERGKAFVKMNTEVPSNVLAEVKDFLMEDPCIVDFDDHFDNVQLDWRNTHIK
mmetsp:Transcript_4421/g.6666  ORF Transcript_4421/g.6666 Transcript_4421/m.6666 type:complete len:173 (+) Transcript_4421:1323-1841(+)